MSKSSYNCSGHNPKRFQFQRLRPLAYLLQYEKSIDSTISLIGKLCSRADDNTSRSSLSFPLDCIKANACSLFTTGMVICTINKLPAGQHFLFVSSPNGFSYTCAAQVATLKALFSRFISTVRCSILHSKFQIYRYILPFCETLIFLL